VKGGWQATICAAAGQTTQANEIGGKECQHGRTQKKTRPMRLVRMRGQEKDDLRGGSGLVEVGIAWVELLWEEENAEGSFFNDPNRGRERRRIPHR